MTSLIDQAIELLKKLIATPSISRAEEKTADILFDFLVGQNVKDVQRTVNNVWCKNFYFDENKPTILLNSHHDTVKPSASYTIDPYTPKIEDGKLFGLGSNDAGGAMINLIVNFLHFYKMQLPYNLILVLSAEEEVSGLSGIKAVLPFLPKLEFAIVGEPTSMEISIAENGLLVLDCVAKGVAGHAARNTGVNAIYKAMEDMAFFRDFKFDKVSPWIGEVKHTVTGVNAGTLHNVVPDSCSFMVDIRFNEFYTHQEIFDLILENIPNKDTEVKPRAFKICPSSMDENHPFITLAKEKGFKLFGSPTCSDRALIPYQSIKIGPGDSNRSHTANEFIYLDEIYKGIEQTNQLLKDFFAK